MEIAETLSMGRPSVPFLKRFENLKSWIPLLSILLCALVFHWLSGEAFLTSRNLSNLSRQVCINLTLAVGMTLVILTSGIDLSVGSVLALSGMLGAISQVKWGWAAWGAMGASLSFLLSMGVGAVSGLATGFAVSRLKITPFIVTLGMMVVLRGLTLIVSGAQAVAPISESLGALSSEYLSVNASLIFTAFVAIGGGCYIAFTRSKATPVPGVYLILFAAIGAWIFGGYRGIPYMVFVVAGCALAGMYLLKYTRFGRFLYAIGGNREAAVLSGVPVSNCLWITYTLMGMLAGLAGAMDIARVNGAVPSAGELAELDAIAAVVIGGTSLMGGIGTIRGTLFGVLILGILNNGMSLIGISEHYQKVFKGLVIILAVYLDMRAKRK